MITLAGAAEALKAGASPSDKTFDGVYPKSLQAISAGHFLPVAVAVRAAHLFEEANVQKVLDVGSGVGKFCVIGALCTKTAEFDQTANLTAEAGDNQWTFPVDVDAEPVPELEFDQTLGW